MNQLNETKKLILFDEYNGGVRSVYRQNKEDETETKVLIYKENDGDIEYEFEGEKIKRIIVENCTEFPPFLSAYD